MAVSKRRIEKNLQVVRERIAEACASRGRDVDDVRIVAVTKSVGLDEIKALLELGLCDLAENRAQQLQQRAEELQTYLSRRRGRPIGPPRWHMVGHLQRNKVKKVLEHSRTIHSVDSLRLAEELNTRGEQAGAVIDVLLQVNCSQEEQKSGVAVGAALHLGELINSMKSIRLVGLMTMAPLTEEEEPVRRTFIRLRELFEEMRKEKIGGSDFRHLSMGMSQDYPIAVEEGATLLRIGTVLFE